MPHHVTVSLIAIPSKFREGMIGRKSPESQSLCISPEIMRSCAKLWKRKGIEKRESRKKWRSFVFMHEEQELHRKY